MSYLTENANLLFPITEADRQQALRFSQQQMTTEKAEQIYRNTLAVLVVEHYLKMLEIEADRSKSHSWNTLTQLTSNVADLYISEARGRLECRSIKSGETKCSIPAELLDQDNWSDRIGCVVVELNDTFTSATLIGFVPTLCVEELPLSYLRSLDELIDQVSAAPKPSALAQWLNGQFEAGWEQLKTRLTQRPIVLMSAISGELNPQIIQFLIREFYRQDEQLDFYEKASENFKDQDALVHLIHTTKNEELRLQAAELLLQIDSEHPNALVAVKRNLGLLIQGHALALIVCVLPKPDGNLLICARVESQTGELPAQLSLTGIDGPTGTKFLQQWAEAGASYIQHLFIAHPGDLFSLSISLNDAQITESFVV